MNLFLPYPDDLAKNAAFLDDGRLNKQVVEAFQIANIVLKLLRDPDCKAGWRNHPSTQLVYNNRNPKLPWLRQYIDACNAEWIARGFKRSEEFTEKINTLFREAEEFANLFSDDPVCSFLGGGELIHGDPEVVGTKYREYLEMKYTSGKQPPRWTPARQSESELPHS